MLYDRLYAKYKDRKTAIKKYRAIRIPLMTAAILLVPAALICAAYFLNRSFGRTFSPVSAGLIWVCAAALILMFFSKDIKNDYRYLRCSHDFRSVIKEHAGGHISGLQTEGSDGFLFSYTAGNDSVTECRFCDGVYTFTVKNDEWDEAAVFRAGTEEDFEKTAGEAIAFALSLEKRPGGEYDESLEPEVEIDEYEDPEDGYEEESEEEEEDRSEE